MTRAVALLPAVLALALAAVAPAAAHDPSAAGAAPAGGSAGPAGEDPLAGRFGGPFSLVDHTGRRVTDADFRGRFLLVTFGFTHCVDVCPVDLAVQQRALDDLGAAADALQPLFVTVDPARDTPEVLARYVADFHPRLLGLTGSEAEIAAVARAFRVHRRKVALEHPDAAHLRDFAGDYIVDHGTLTFLIGPDGRFLTLIPHTTDPGRVADVLGRYLPAG